MQHKFLAAVLLAGVLVGCVGSTDYNNIEYLCCDWGPAMTLPSATNTTTQFNDAEDEIYFLKQFASFTREKKLMKGIWSRHDYEDRGKGSGIFLCKMKPDGSAKTEIMELWKNPAYPIDMQGPSVWMNVHRKTRTIAFSITYAGSAQTGLWTVDLDGKNLKRIIEPGMEEGRSQCINHPSWMPDGQWIVYEAGWRGTSPSHARIARCDRDGNNRTYLTEGPEDRQPSVSPNGSKIVYLTIGATTGGLVLMDASGANAHALPNPADKHKGRHSGTWPEWSPDEKRIFATGTWEIEVATGKKVTGRSPRMISLEGKVLEEHSNVIMPHWGRLGLLCGGWGGGITVVDHGFENQKILALSATRPATDRW